MPTGSSYWDRLFEKIQNILSALSGGEPVINDDYQNVQSSFWKMLFEKLDMIIVAIVSGGGGGGTTNHAQLTNRAAADQHPMSAITGLTQAVDGKVDKSFTNPDGSVTAIAANGTITRTYTNGSYDKFLTETDGGGYLRYNSADQSTLFIGADGGNLEIYDKTGTGEGVRIRERVVDGKRCLYYQEDGANREPVSTDELVNRRVMAAYVSGETGKPVGAFATRAALLLATGMTVNDYAYVLADETRGGETWRYDYDGSAWIASIRINEVQSVPDNDTLFADDQNIWGVNSQSFAVTENTDKFTSGATLTFKSFWQSVLGKINGLIQALAGKQAATTADESGQLLIGGATPGTTDGVGADPLLLNRIKRSITNGSTGSGQYFRTTRAPNNGDILKIEVSVVNGTGGATAIATFFLNFSTSSSTCATTWNGRGTAPVLVCTTDNLVNINIGQSSGYAAVASIEWLHNQNGTAYGSTPLALQSSTSMSMSGTSRNSFTAAKNTA